MPDGSDDYVDEGHGNHEFPGEAHELIGSEPRQGAPQPDEEGHEREQLYDKPKPARNEIQERERRLPSAQEQSCAHAAHGEESHVFSQEKKSKFESGIFREITSHQFRFSLREIKWG